MFKNKRHTRNPINDRYSSYNFGIWAWGLSQITTDVLPIHFVQETIVTINNIFTEYTLVDTLVILRSSLISCLQCDLLLLGKLISSLGKGVKGGKLTRR